MIALLAVLVSGVLLNAMDVPVPDYHLVFTDDNGKLVGVMTDKEGRFQVDLAPGDYRLYVGLDQTDIIRVDAITVDQNGSKWKLKVFAKPHFPIQAVPPTQRDLPPGARGALAPVIEEHEHLIEIIQGTQRDIVRFPLDPPGPVAPVIRPPLNAPPPVIEAPKPPMKGDFPLPVGPPRA